MSLSPEAKGLLKGIPIFSAIGAVIGFFLAPSTVVQTTGIIDFSAYHQLPANINYVLGVAIGAVVAIIKILLLELSVEKAMKKGNAQHAAIYMRLAFMPRFLFTVAALVVSIIFLGLFGIIGVLVGSTSATISAYIIKFLIKRDKKSAASKETKNP